ncbi:MAG: hypothetical protein ACOC0U_02875 [Desulfovibrionales bacterium]
MKNLFFAEKEDIPIQVPDGVNLLQIPIEGVAAYWLSIKKTMTAKKNSRFVEKELDHIREPFFRHLFEIGFSSFDSDQIRRFATIKKQTVLTDLKRKLYLMLITLMGISNKENPQQILIRIISRFPISPVLEKEVFAGAQQLLERYKFEPEQVAREAVLDYGADPTRFIQQLIFFPMLSRRQGWDACTPFIPYLRCPLFSEGLSLIMDGFEYDFIKHRLNLQKNEILHDSETKMDMSMEMLIGIRENLSYEDVFRIARSFML